MREQVENGLLCVEQPALAEPADVLALPSTEYLAYPFRTVHWVGSDIKEDGAVILDI